VAGENHALEQGGEAAAHAVARSPLSQGQLNAFLAQKPFF
jgi:hypothetical protein